MVIDIPSESKLSDATIISSFLIEEEIESSEIQQPEQQPEIEPMAWTRKKLAPAAGPATTPTNIPTPSSCPMLNPF